MAHFVGDHGPFLRNDRPKCAANLSTVRSFMSAPARNRDSVGCGTPAARATAFTDLPLSRSSLLNSSAIVAFMLVSVKRQRPGNAPGPAYADPSLTLPAFSLGHFRFVPNLASTSALSSAESWLSMSATPAA